MAVLTSSSVSTEGSTSESGERRLPAAKEPRLGGKGEGLVRLVELGARVPPFFVVDARNLQEALEANDLLSEVSEAHAALRQAIRSSDPQAPKLERALQECIRTLALPQAIRSAISDQVRALGPGPWAVRSSMIGEDSASHSFAGQLESYLFRRSIEEVEDAVKECWASAFSARLTSYRLSASHEGMPQVGVVVQRMIDGEVSGVCFTADPKTGRRDRMLLSAAWGLGEGVVGGSCNTDEFETDERGNELTVAIADKDIEVVAGPDGFGTRERSVPEARRRERCLSTQTVSAITRECARIAEAMGRPQDIEWTVLNGTLYILQSRPITNLKVPDNLDGPRVIFDNSNIQESYCGVTTPLTFSFASQSYACVYRQAFGVFGVSDRELPKHDAVFRNLLGLVRGRVYYNLNNWYRMLLLLPSFRRNKTDMEKMMGVTEPVDFVEDETPSLKRSLARLPRLARTLVGVLWALRNIDAKVQAWMNRFDAILARTDRPGMNKLSFSALMERKQIAERDLLEHWSIPIVNDLYVMAATGHVRRLLAKAGFPESERPGLESALIGGEEGIESIEPTRELMRIAALARQDDATCALIRREKSSHLLNLVAQQNPALHARIMGYLERYGDRVMGELKLESISLYEDPSFIFDVLRGYLDRPDLSADALAHAERKRRDDAEALLLSKLRPWSRKKAMKTLEKARHAVKNRENMRLRRTRAFGLYRDIMRAVGLRLYEAGKLNEPRDVFYLTVPEIESYYEGRAASANLAPIAEARKAEFHSYLERDLPHRFETRGPVYHGNRYEGPAQKAPEGDGRTLFGLGCSGGVIESEARVILDAKDELSVNGKILVTVRTDPGWAPLFPTCSGVLVERGSTLSHSAVVARELGIPAVVGVPGLLDRVKNGQRVRLDGSKGQVDLLGDPS